MSDFNRSNYRRPKKDSEALWVLAIILAFVFAWPLGIVLLVIKGRKDKEQKRREEERAELIRQAKAEARAGTSYSYRYENGRPVSTAPAAETAERPVSGNSRYGKENSSLKKQKNSYAKAKAPAKRKKKATWGYNLAAGICSFVGLTMTFDLIGDWMYWGYLENYMVEDLFFAILFLAVGLVVFWLGMGIRKRERNFARYSNVIGNRTVISLEAVASVMSKSADTVAKELQQLIDRDYFGSAAYIDHGKMELILDANAVELKAEPKEEPVAQVKAEEDLPDSERQKILREIREMDILIADPVVSEKIVRIEELTDKILSLVENKPEKKSQIRSFMNYYLPTTLKLLKAYSEFEAQGVEGETITKAKDSIAEIMDNLIAAFEQQLDQLFSSEAMDISSDIEVLENMMRRDGFSDDGLKMTRM